MRLDAYIPVYEDNEVHTILIRSTPAHVFKALKELTVREWSPLVPMSFSTQKRRISRSFWRRMSRLNQRMARNYVRGFGPRKLVLLLTTTGRKSGLPRVTPLQYEHQDGVFYVASARGQQADWFRNLLANPQVRVQIENIQFDALAEPITDPARIADFLELRLRRHPFMIRLMLAAEGLPLRFKRAELEQFAGEKAVAALHPCQPVPDLGR